MKIAIIGGDPIGLYLALKLVHAGVHAKNIIICDPHAGEYTYPRRLNKAVFETIQKLFNLTLDDSIFQEGPFTEFEPLNRVQNRYCDSYRAIPKPEYAHTKDFEQILYSEVLKLGILIEKKYFISLEDNGQKTGVIVKNAEGIKEVIPADYVVDCTGSNRHVVNAVNQLCPDQPFKLKVITNMPIETCFLAYVKMKKEIFDTLQNKLTYISNDLFFARNLLHLRNLGWNEFTFPNYSKNAFSNNDDKKAGFVNACIFIEMPNRFPKEQHAMWFDTALALNGSPIEYQRLPESEEYPVEATFTAFTIEATSLDKMSYKMGNRLTILPMGDSQVSLNYSREKGICYGMERADALLSAMTIANGEILFFDEDQYLIAINLLLENHKNEIIDHALQSRNSISDEEKRAKTKLQHAINLTDDPFEKHEFNKMLNKIETRIAVRSNPDTFSFYSMKFNLFKYSNSCILLPKELGFLIAKTLIDLIVQDIHEHEAALEKPRALVV